MINRISIVGISGSGKSTYSRLLGSKTGLPVYHMDSLLFGPDWEEITIEKQIENRNSIISQDKWILEGYIADEYHLSRSELTIFLDLPRIPCAWGVFKRGWEYRNIPRPELAEGCTDDFNFYYIWHTFLRLERKSILSCINNTDTSKVLTFYTRSAALNYLDKY